MNSLLHNRRLVEYRNIKRLAGVSAESKSMIESHHCKAKTQNVCMYNTLYSHQSRQQDYAKQNTCLIGKKPNSNAESFKQKPRNRHELQLQKELADYKKEVEFKFNNSITNKGYLFPRKCKKTTEYDNVFPEEIISVSIYNQVDTNNNDIPKFNISKKSNSQEKKDFRIKTNINKYVINAFNTNSKNKSIRYFKENFKTSNMKYHGDNIIPQKAMKLKHEDSLNLNSALTMKTLEGIQADTKIHLRTQTLNIDNLNGYRNITQTINMGNDYIGGQTANYFKSVITNKVKLRVKNIPVLRMKARIIKEDILSFSTLLENCNSNTNG